MLFRYSVLCGMASDAVDAVRSASAQSSLKAVTPYISHLLLKIFIHVIQGLL